MQSCRLFFIVFTEKATRNQNGMGQEIGRGGILPSSGLNVVFDDLIGAFGAERSRAFLSDVVWTENLQTLRL